MVDLEKHAKAIAAAYLIVPTPEKPTPFLAACRALFDAGAEAMREAAVNIIEDMSPYADDCCHDTRGDCVQAIHNCAIQPASVIEVTK